MSPRTARRIEIVAVVEMRAKGYYTWVFGALESRSQGAGSVLDSRPLP